MMQNNLLAQGIVNPLLNQNLQNTTGVDYLQKLITALVTLAFVVGVVLFLFMLIIGAIQWISSGGDKANLEAARGKITNALIGLVVLFLIIAIIKLLETFFGINILQLDLGPLQIS